MKFPAAKGRRYRARPLKTREGFTYWVKVKELDKNGQDNTGILILMF